MFLEWENNSRTLQTISGKFQNSRKFQNNAISNVKQISVSHVIDTITADDKYSFRNRENLPQPIEIQLSKKQKDFSQFFAAFLKST